MAKVSLGGSLGHQSTKERESNILVFQQATNKLLDFPGLARQGSDDWYATVAYIPVV